MNLLLKLTLPPQHAVLIFTIATLEALRPEKQSHEGARIYQANDISD